MDRGWGSDVTEVTSDLDAGGIKRKPEWRKIELTNFKLIGHSRWGQLHGKVPGVPK